MVSLTSERKSFCPESRSVKRSQDKGTLTPLPTQDREPEEKPHDESGDGYEWAGAK